MGDLVEEVRQWHSPTTGAYLLWKFTTGYHKSHPAADAPVALLHFMASPLLTNTRLLQPINGHRKNLQSYVKSFEDSEDVDLLSTVHEKVKHKRDYTLAAIDIAIAAGLLVWEIENGKLWPRSLSTKVSRGNAIKPAIARDGKKAELLGRWFAEHSIPAIATYLKVVL